MLQNLLSTPATEFPARYITDLKEMFACVLEWVGKVSNEEFGKYTYLDLICLACLSAETLIRTEHNTQNCVLLLSEQVFLKFLQKTASYCTPADLFCAVNFKELLNILDELAGLPQTSFSELIKLTRRINDGTFRYDLTSRSTVKDLIDQTESVIKQYWRPWDDLKSFRSDVMVGYEVIHMVAFLWVFLAEYHQQQSKCSRLSGLSIFHAYL